MEDFASWSKAKIAKQAKTKPHDQPAFTSAEMQAKLDDLRQAFSKLKDRKKPKPPPVAGTKNGTANATAANSNSTGGAEGSAESAGPSGANIKPGSYEDMVRPLEPLQPSRTANMLWESLL